MRGLPVTAWWGPAGYGGNDTSSEFEAYAAAGFTIALVSDRGSTRCTGNVTADSAASWAVIQQQLAHCKARGMQSLIDTYRCTPWGGEAQYGGDSQGAVGTYVSRTANHKVGEKRRGGTAGVYGGGSTRVVYNTSIYTSTAGVYGGGSTRVVYNTSIYTSD